MRSRTIEARRAPVAGKAAVASPWLRRPALLLLAAFLLTTLAFSSRADAFVYWAAGSAFGSGDTISRANLDGTGAGVFEFDGEPAEYTFIVAENPGGVAVNGAHFYFANGGSDYPRSIGRANLDGSGVNQTFITASAGDGVAVDGAHVYWAGPEAIGRAKLDGTGVEESFITLDPDSGVPNHPTGVAVDGAHVYWTSQPGCCHEAFQPGRIGRANLDGTGVEQSFITADGIPQGVAVDGAHVYWANRRDSGDSIGRANLDGSGVEHSFITADGPCGVAVHGTHVYWANKGGSPGSAGSIGRANLDGSGVNQSFIAERPDCGIAVDALSAPAGTGNEFSFGKVKRNKKKGTAKLVVKVPAPGELELAKTKKVKPQSKLPAAEGKVQLAIKPKAKSKRALRKTGKAKVVAKVTYTPDGGEPNTEKKRLKLIKR